jgi:hypothetical protein
MMGGGIHDTPSGAAAAITRYWTDGWRFWSYLDPEGQWVPLSRLRR